MKCPNCSLEADEGAQECPGCHLIFAKWKAAAERPRPAAQSASSEGGSGKWVGLVILAACAWGYSRFSGKSADAGLKSAGAVTAKESTTHSSGTFTPPSDHCGYEGRVLDLALQTPIPGAKVYLGAYVGSANASGRYRIIVRSMRGECNPFPSVRHPDYQKNYWTRHFPDISPEERLAMREKVFTPERIKGEAGKATVVNFSLFPNTIPESLLNQIAKNAEETEIEEIPEQSSEESAVSSPD